jgi:hypothetical protein
MKNSMKPSIDVTAEDFAGSCLLSLRDVFVRSPLLEGARLLIHSIVARKCITLDFK